MQKSSEGITVYYPNLDCQSVWLGSLSKKRHPMAKLVYNLLSVQDLKRRQKENHLSMQGSRDQLVRRLQDFVHLYNAQCDSLNPKSGE